MGKPSQRNRSVLRKIEREVKKVLEEREKLAQLDVGGSPSFPKEVASASLVEVQAVADRCIRCTGETGVIEHAAEVISGKPLRRVKIGCKQCGHKRDIYFKICSPMAN